MWVLTDICTCAHCTLDAIHERLNVSQTAVETLSCERMNCVGGITHEYCSCSGALADVRFRMREPQWERRDGALLDRRNERRDSISAFRRDHRAILVLRTQH